ncbi:MAG: DNA recombination protein RmuC [Porticoccaceae bacterium]|nr:DNA recombination protein RmuC [Porticoccaceae bacterium]
MIQAIDNEVLISLLPVLGLGLVLGLLAGFLWSRRKYGQRQRQADAELAEANQQLAVLEERLSSNAQRYEERLAELKTARQSLSQEFENLANRIFDAKQEKFSRQSKQTLEHSLAPVREELKSFRKKVEDVYDKENADRNRLVGQITELQKQAQQISQGAENLTNALKGESKVQGNWGEVVLERLLEESGLRQGREYQTQASFTDSDGKRKMPDVIVRLPDERDIVIDAKVSLTDYERYCSAEDDDQRQQYLKAHINSLRAHITGLSRKGYEQLEEIRTLDFVLIFVPIEAAFMAALENDHSLFRDAYDKGIILVSPSTLLATLRTIHNIWRFEDQNRNAEKIAKQAGGLYDQFVLLIEAFNDVGKHLEKSQVAWETASKRLHSGRGNLVKRVEDIKVLGAKAKKQIARESLERALDAQDSEQITEDK